MRKIGQYRHRPGGEHYGRPGGETPAVGLNVGGPRRRFRYLPLVFFGSAMLTPILAYLAAEVLRLLGVEVRLSADNRPAPPPGIENLFFGLGLPETALGGGIAGLWLWRRLWGTLHGVAGMGGPFTSGFRPLLPHAVAGGILAVMLALAVAQGGAYLRTAPEEQPWLVRPLFGLISVILVGFSALFTFTLPLAGLAAGVVVGVLYAVAALTAWRRLPFEAGRDRSDD